MASGIRHPLFWSTATAVVVLDVITKRLALASLADGPVPVLGEWLVLRLVFNPGAAFGIHVGPYSRWVFLVLALVALVVLGAMARETAPKQWFRLTALALVCGGALGRSRPARRGGPVGPGARGPLQKLWSRWISRR